MARQRGNPNQPQTRGAGPTAFSFAGIVDNAGFAAIGKSIGEAITSTLAAKGAFAGRTIGQTLGGIVGPGAAVGGAVGGAIGQAGGTVAGLVAPFRAATSAIGSFVEKANPKAMERLNIAFDDVTAVVGQALTPVIEALTPAVRLFGDFLKSILPSADEFKDALAPFGELLSELRDSLAPVAPIIKDTLVTGLRLLGEALRIVLIPIKALFRLLGDLFGVEGDKAAPLKSSVGAASRQIRFEDPTTAARGVYQAAFMARTGAGAREKTPLDKIGEKIDSASAWLEKIFGADSEVVQTLTGIAKDVAAFAEKFLKPITDAVEGVVDKVVKGWDMIFDKIADALVPGNKYQPPRDPDKAKTFDQLARTFGQATRPAQGIGMLPFQIAREAAGGDQLRKLIDQIRVLAEKAGVGGKYEEDIQEILDFAKITAKRGVEGHS